MGVTSLSQKLAGRIRENGPISIAEFMDAALGDAEFGYYMTRDPFGARGDFITAPEISQMFGELLGLWCASLWMQIGSPAHVHLAEIGPGRGTLMADMLRATKSVPGFYQALSVHLVEMSPHLKSIQSETLRKSAVDVQWHPDISTLPDGPLLLVANEFFDALPIRQFVKTTEGWCERMVDVTAEDQFKFELGSSTTRDMPDASVGSILETCKPATDIVTALTQRIVAQGGGALFIDYGYEEPATGDTLQAVSNHKFTSVLDNPGEQDLTAHVNFSSLVDTAQIAGGAAFGPITQAQLLFGLGLEARANTLIKASTPAQSDDIQAAATRLTNAEQMGTLFKAIAITQNSSIVPVPFT